MKKYLSSKNMGSLVLLSVMTLLPLNSRGDGNYGAGRYSGLLNKEDPTIQKIEEVGKQVQENLSKMRMDADEFAKAYREEFRKLYGKDGVVSETVEVALEKARPVMDAYVHEFRKMYVGKDSTVSQLAREAVQKAKPLVDAYGREFRTLYVGSDSEVAKLAREALQRTKDTANQLSDRFNNEVKPLLVQKTLELKEQTETLAEDYEREFRRLYIGPDSKLSEVTKVAIEKSKPIVDAYVREFVDMYVGSDSKAAKLFRETGRVSRELLAEAIKRAKPAIDAYVNEFKTMYIGSDSTVAQLAREAMKYGKPLAQGYAHEFEKMYVGPDSTAGKAIGHAYETVKPLVKAYGHEFQKMYIGPDATAWRATRNAKDAVVRFTNEQVIPTLRDWLDLDEFDDQPDRRFVNPPLAPLLSVAMTDEEKPVNIGTDREPKFAFPPQHASQLAKNGANPNEVDPRRLILTQAPDGFAIAAYGMTPAAAASMSCNSSTLQGLISAGAKVNENPVILSSIYDAQAKIPMSAEIADLLQFRVFVLGEYLKTVAKDRGKSDVAKNMLARCRATQEVIHRALGLNNGGDRYSLPEISGTYHR